ncbi:MAG: hypothetical protein GC191_16495 [Azospirillum sp.]|nr:hypothetical protein [Azospirillum sp.]
MTGRIARLFTVIAMLALAIANMTTEAVAQEAAAVRDEPTVAATPELIRDVQLRLEQLGIPPGPIDGIAGPQTNRAIRFFEARYGLPMADLVIDGRIAKAVLDELQPPPDTPPEPTAPAVAVEPAPPPVSSPPEPPPVTAAVPEPLPEPVPAPMPPPAAAAAAEPAAPPVAATAPEPPPPEQAVPLAGQTAMVPPPPPVDRFGACPLDNADLKIGRVEYTPDSFLAQGFGGSAERAVTTLRQRLEEARRLATQIGGPALLEVQRQGRVLHYFECRLSVESGSSR